jgi:hypothetical protein
MPINGPERWVPLLYQALAEPFGLLLTTNDVARAKAQIYAARKLASDPELDCLQLRTSPFTEGELVLVRGAKPPNTETELSL